MKRLTIITIIIIVILVGGIWFFVFVQKGRDVQQPPTTSVSPPSFPPQPILSPISPPQPFLPSTPPEDLNSLWLNGERCPKKGFSIPSKKEDLVVKDGINFFVNVVDVNFTDVATCKDAERIALLINAKIVGFGSVTNLYEFEVPTRTVSELESAIAKVKALNDPKIEGVFSVVPLTPEPVP